MAMFGVPAECSNADHRHVQICGPKQSRHACCPLSGHDLSTARSVRTLVRRGRLRPNLPACLLASLSGWAPSSQRVWSQIGRWPCITTGSLHSKPRPILCPRVRSKHKRAPNRDNKDLQCCHDTPQDDAADFRSRPPQNVNLKRTESRLQSADSNAARPTRCAASRG